MWILFALASALLFSVMQVFEKKALKHSTAEGLLFSRALVLFIVLALAFPFLKLSWEGPIHIPIAAAAFIQLGFFMLLKATKGAELSRISPFINLTPIFVIFISLAFLGEAPRLLQSIGIIMIVAGTLLVDDPRKLLGRGRSHMLYATGTAVSWAIAGTLLRYTFLHMDTVTAIFTVEAAGTVMALAAGAVLIGGKQISSIRHCSICVVLSAAALLGSNILVNLALAEPNGLASAAIAVRRTSTLFTVAIGGLLLHEHHFTHRAASTAIALFGVFLVALG
jgi:drug/metabolite transporter (DMT)-like permease